MVQLGKVSVRSAPELRRQLRGAQLPRSVSGPTNELVLRDVLHAGTVPLRHQLVAAGQKGSGWAQSEGQPCSWSNVGGGSMARRSEAAHNTLRAAVGGCGCHTKKIPLAGTAQGLNRAMPSRCRPHRRCWLMPRMTFPPSCFSSTTCSRPAAEPRVEAWDAAAAPGSRDGTRATLRAGVRAGARQWAEGVDAARPRGEQGPAAGGAGAPVQAGMSPCGWRSSPCAIQVSSTAAMGSASWPPAHGHSPSHSSAFSCSPAQAA